jgi:hypothetical protein
MAAHESLPTIDPYVVIIFLLFLGAVAAGAYSVVDAWHNELAAIQSRDESVALLGLVDLLTMLLLVAGMAAPGVVLGVILFTTISPIQGGDATPRSWWSPSSGGWR